MFRATAFAATLFVFVAAACSSGELGEACEDEGRVGGDCAGGLMCARQNADEVSALVCLKPCVAATECAADEVCSGDRGRNLTACRKR